VTKPVTGVLDLGSKTLEGIKNTTTYGSAVVQRRRPPRVFGPEGEIKRYDLFTATGEEFLYSASRHLHENEHYCWHEAVAKGKTVLLTDRQILMMRKKTNEIVLRWKLPLADIDEIHTQGLNIILKVNERARHLFGIGAEKRIVATGPQEVALIEQQINRCARMARTDALSRAPPRS